MNIPESSYPRVVVVGGGFAGSEMVRKLSAYPFQIILLDRNNYFTFQPLLYQVATAGLETNSVVSPLRRLFRADENILFRVGELKEVDSEKQRLFTSIGPIHYDYLVIATGSKPQFFDLQPEKLLTLKTLSDAAAIRNTVFEGMEKAVTLPVEDRPGYMNIVIVGGGPTGVELAGAFAEMKKYVFPKDYPGLDLKQMEIHLIEGQDRLLSTMSTAASENARKFLEKMGVKVWLNELVEDYDGESIAINGRSIPCRNLIWSAGVVGNAVRGLTTEQIYDNKRIIVDKYNRVIGSKNIFAIGDVAHQTSENFPKGLPMLAPVAIQQGKHLANNLNRMRQKEDLIPFEYVDKGTMATIGRNKAVADLPFVKIKGTLAWLAWMFVHLITLVGFRNKVITLINWIYNYFTYDRALRIIFHQKEKKFKPKEKAENLVEA